MKMQQLFMIVLIYETGGDNRVHLGEMEPLKNMGYDMSQIISPYGRIGWYSSNYAKIKINLDLDDLFIYTRNLK